MTVMDFAELSEQGRLRRLRTVAMAALDSYGITPRRLELAGASFNTIFRVRTDDDRLLALRVGPRERIHPPGCEEAEASWLDHLADHGAAVRRALRTLDGRASTTVTVDGVPHSRTCMVFGWTPGSMLRSRPNAPGLAAAGRLCATLHEIAADGAQAPPHGVATADRVVYFVVPDRLHTLTGTYGSLFVDARARVDEALHQLWTERSHIAHLIHGDLTPANVVMYHGHAGAIDFQDMVWGLDIQDISVVHASLSREPDHLGLAAAFRAGYEQRRPWPETTEHDMSALVAARRLSIANLNIAVGWPNAAASVDRQAAFLRTYLSEDGDSRARH